MFFRMPMCVFQELLLRSYIGLNYHGWVGISIATMFVRGQGKSLKARRLVGHFARQALCWARVRREPLVPYRRQSEDYRETGFWEIKPQKLGISLVQHFADLPVLIRANRRPTESYASGMPRRPA
jgi:hypothetical protein